MAKQYLGQCRPGDALTEFETERVGLDARFAQNSTLRRNSCGIRAFHKRSFAQVIVHETANVRGSPFKTLFRTRSGGQSPATPFTAKVAGKTFQELPKPACIFAAV